MEIRYIRKDEIALLQDFISCNISDSHILARDQQFLTWQYPSDFLDDAQENELSIVVAIEDNHIVGFLGLIGFQLNNQGDLFSGVWLSNWYVAQSHRRGALGLLLLKHVLDSPSIIFNGTIGHNHNSEKVFRAFRYEMRDDLPRCVGVLNEMQCRNFFINCPEPIEEKKFKEQLKGCKISIVNPENSMTITHWDGSLSWDLCWEKYFSQSYIGVNRDSDYLRWRYLNHPVFEYDVFVVLDGSKVPQGLAVCRIETASNQHTVLRILDFFSVAQAEDQLCYHLVNYGLQKEVSYIDFYCMRKKTFRPFIRQGFKEISGSDFHYFPSRLCPIDLHRFTFPIAFMFKKDEKVERLMDSAHLYFTKSDADMDRPR